MNRIWTKFGKYFAVSLGVSSLLATSVLGAATQFISPNYKVESIIFGGTGVLRSSDASIPPVIVTGPVVSSITTNSAIVLWATDKPSNGIVMLGTESGVYGVETGQLSDVTSTSHDVQLTSLKKNTLYYYKVRSQDVAGNTVESAEKNFLSDAGDITAPVLIGDVNIAVNSASSVTVSWETDEPSSSIVEYGSSTVSDNSVGRSEELTTFHQVNVTGLQSDQNYLLRVVSRDNSGNTYTGSTKNMTTPNSPGITDVKLSDITLNSVVVEWKTTTPSTSVVRYGLTSDYSEKQEDVSFSDTHTVRLTNLVNGTIYHLRLAGSDRSNNRLSSDEYIFKTVILPTISNLKVTEITSYTALVTWTSSSDIDELLRYDVTANEDKTLVGKRKATGNDKLVTDHSYLLSDLEEGSSYTITVMGKDVFGNQAISEGVDFKTPVDREPPKILNIRTDTSVDLGSKQSVQVLVSFGLSKPGIAMIEYGEGATGSYTEKIDNDTDLTQNKFMVISKLVPGQSYHFRIKAKDKAKNEAVSADYLVLAPTQQVSLLDLIFGQITQNFGWVSKL